MKRKQTKMKHQPNGSKTQHNGVDMVRMEDVQQGMMVEERRRRILDILDEARRVTVRDLAETFSVSA